MMNSSTAPDDPFLAALRAQQVEATVSDFDHYRIRGGMAVETDYIISVKSKKDGDTIEPFKLSKTYSHFRTFSSQLKKASETNLTKESELTSEASSMIRFAHSVNHMIESQRTQYIGKVNYTYVQSLAKQRSQIINDVLDLTISNYPAETTNKQACVKQVAQTIVTFFLTDHCEELSEDEEEGPLGVKKVLNFTPSVRNVLPGLTPAKKKHRAVESGGVPVLADDDDVNADDMAAVKRASAAFGGVTSPVVPLTRKTRRSMAVRYQDQEALGQMGDSANLLLDDDRGQPTLVPNYNNPVPTVHSLGSNKLGYLVENSPVVFLGILGASVVMLHNAAIVSVTIDLDVALLIVFACFCVGLHMPRPSISGIDTPAVTTKPKVAFERPSSARRASTLIRRSMMAKSISPRAASVGSAGEVSVEVMEEVGEELLIDSPMAMFPDDAEIGEYTNRWSAPDACDFKVRGPKYLRDKKKVQSGEFIFPPRGVDLLLTDTCPENVGTNSGIMGGQLRDVPTFIVNFRLPWGVLLFYAEIPERFLPFIKKKFDPNFDEEIPSLDTLTPSDRTVCRFLLGDQKHKDQTLKIVPIVIEGPWIVKSVVGGKPAIVGTKLPMNYVYQAAEGKKAMYLEADLDIVASSAARSVLSVCQSYVEILTMDLGFVIEGKQEDELPEQMLLAARLHRIDPLTAPDLPPMKNALDNIDMGEVVPGESLTDLPKQ